MKSADARRGAARHLVVSGTVAAMAGDRLVLLLGAGVLVAVLSVVAVVALATVFAPKRSTRRSAARTLDKLLRIPPA
ncbi:hypothetical protein MUY14_42655 [Amycolatopsis sp. FBCC-B4732]|uniref:hypothetical protein n=1 Tax=Amycolatopsis sp. FBCC-B4732 TaxID=3079339 RepID=UPI001FF65724|nr:hypothetical protein [Amycolatopsis sp. FBCC-B4732]UOX88318.1 hypothetical protein MUY14_42655 [Amycolatopsis sp. FBCC-B4732]